MTVFGIIGYPLTHSFSRQYFTSKIEREQVADEVFEEFPLATIEAFPQLLTHNPSLKGLAVTIPYKEKVLPYISVLSSEVKQIGAANCITINGNTLTAYNTDIIGFEKSFVPLLNSSHSKALVLGTGGASKAVQYVLKKLGIEFLLVSRQENTLQNTITYDSLDAEKLKTHTVVINCTPLGMLPNDETAPHIPYHLLTPRHYLYDLVYQPQKTLFLQKGERQGAVIKNGYEMLLVQAEENWRIWHSA